MSRMDAGAHWASGSSQRCFAGALDPFRASHARRGARAPFLQAAAQEVRLLTRQGERGFPRKPGRRFGQPGMPVRLPAPDDARIVGPPVTAATVRERRKARVVPALTLRMPEDAPPRQRAPVERARQAGQRTAGDDADDAFLVFVPFERTGSARFPPPRGLLHLGRADPLVL